jgi:hypothetical protein
MKELVAEKVSLEGCKDLSFKKNSRYFEEVV